MRHQTFDALVSVLGKGTIKQREEYYQKNNAKIHSWSWGDISNYHLNWPIEYHWMNEWTNASNNFASYHES